jgi:hypothetical protein
VLRRTRTGTTARSALHQAQELYRDWGAHAKVRQIELDLADTEPTPTDGH